MRFYLDRDKKKINFYQDYYAARNAVTGSNEYKYTQSFILDVLYPYIRRIQAENPDKNEDELYDILKAKSFDLAKTSFISTYAFDYYMSYVACKYLQANPSIFDEIYQKLQSGELTVDPVKQNIHSNNSFYDYLVQYIHSVNLKFKENSELFDIIEERYPFFKELKENDKLTEEEKIERAQKFLRTHFSAKLDRDRFSQAINWYIKGLRSFLPMDEKLLEKELRESLSKSISSIASQLTSLNLFERYKNTELQYFKKMHFEGFITDTKKVDITNPETLKNKEISITDLMILNSFWMNRYAKELTAYANGMFAIESLDLLPDIMEGTLSLGDIHKDAIIGILTKCKFLQPHIQEFISSQQIAYFKGELKKSSYDVHEGEHFITFSFDPLASNINKKYSSPIGVSTEYAKMFDEEFPFLYNDLKDDIDSYSTLLSPIGNIYDIKTEIIQVLLSTLYINRKLNIDRKLVNAGIIPDSISEDGTKISLDPNFVCIGFDKGTFPVREHIKLSALQEFLISMQNDQTYIPIYVGANDFRFTQEVQTSRKSRESSSYNYPNTRQRDDIIPAQLVLPFSKEQRKYIKKFIQELHQNGPSSQLTPQDIAFIEHLNWLRDPSAIPEKYLTGTPEKGKKKTFQPTYINIGEYVPGTPLQIYTLSNDGEYVPVKRIFKPQNTAAFQDISTSQSISTSNSIVNPNHQKGQIPLGKKAAYSYLASNFITHSNASERLKEHKYTPLGKSQKKDDFEMEL